MGERKNILDNFNNKDFFTDETDLKNHKNKLEVDTEQQVEQLLSQVDEEFSNLETLAREMEEENLKQETMEAMNNLIIVMNQAQDAGFSIERIRSLLPNAYKVQGYSSFGNHLRQYKTQQGHFSSIDILVDKIETGAPDIPEYYQRLGKIIGNMALECPLAQQHRNKLIIQADVVKKVCETVKSPHIIMVASGSARDLEKIQRTLIQSNARITLIDIYPEALDEALNNLREFSDGVENVDEKLKTYPVDVNSLFRTKSESSKKFRKEVFAGQADLLVAGGLFDYFRDVSIRRFLETINIREDNIKDGGKVLFTNIADGVNNPWLVWAEVMGHWRLRSRTKDKMEELQKMLGFSKNLLELDPTGLTWIATSINEK